MPNIKSAAKRMRQSSVRRLRNRSRVARMRTAIKALRRLLDEGQVEEARQQLPRVYAVIDRTARKGSIHANTAARYKSRLTRHVNRAAAA